jgi:hypothetical protein
MLSILRQSAIDRIPVTPRASYHVSATYVVFRKPAEPPNLMLF